MHRYFLNYDHYFETKPILLSHTLIEELPTLFVSGSSFLIQKKHKCITVFTIIKSKNTQSNKRHFSTNGFHIMCLGRAQYSGIQNKKNSLYLQKIIIKSSCQRKTYGTVFQYKHTYNTTRYPRY